MAQLNTTRHVLPTLARQLAASMLELRPHIIDAARAHLEKGERQQLRYQIDDLLVKPLENFLSNYPPLVIIIDALDECTVDAQGSEIPQLLILLMQGIRRLKFQHLRILLTTRPELHIEKVFDIQEFYDISKPFKLQDVPHDEVDTDISRFFEAGLAVFKPDFRARILVGWPTIVEDLTKKSEGLFIYASTARK